MTTELKDKLFADDDISTPCADYLYYLQERKLIDTLMGGTKAMRKAGLTYLPQEEAESDIAYQNRIQRSFLLNIYKRTVKKLSGIVFSKPIIINTKDKDIRELLFDFDLEGNNINVVSFRFFADAISSGVSHILVDYPDINIINKDGQVFVYTENGMELLSKKKEKQMGLRPFCTQISAKNIIGWKYGTVNGVKKLINVRIKDQIAVPTGKYNEELKNRIRVLSPGAYETYIENENKYELTSAGITGLDYIPLFSFFTGEERRGLVADFPLEDLAYLNLEHWQSSSDQRNILHYARLITFLGKCLDDALEDKKIVIGANQIVNTSDPAGDLKVVESSGQAIESGAEDLRQIEKQMLAFGLSLMDNKVSRETATSRLLDSMEANSTLKNWALNFNDVLNNIIECMADYLGKEKKSLNATEDIPNYVTVNSDINPSFGADSSSILLASFKDDVIDKENLLIEFKRRGILREEADIDYILKETKDKEIDLTSGAVIP